MAGVSLLTPCEHCPVALLELGSLLDLPGYEDDDPLEDVQRLLAVYQYPFADISHHLFDHRLLTREIMKVRDGNLSMNNSQFDSSPWRRNWWRKHSRSHEAEKAC